MELNWDKDAAAKLRELGLSWDHAMIAVGLIAEHRQMADRDGYNRGFESGYEFAVKRFNFSEEEHAKQLRGFLDEHRHVK